MTTISTSPSRAGALRLLASTFALICSGQAIADITQIPPIPRPRAAPVSAAFAQSLAAWDKEQEVEANECAQRVAEIKAEDADATIEAGFDLAYEVLLDTPSVYSVAVNLNGFCGGPYPFHAETSAVFDVTTGRRYNPLDLYAIARKGKYGYEFLPQVRTVIRKKLIAARGVPEKGDDCIQTLKDDDIRFSESRTVVFSKEGLKILYSGPHVVQACYEPVMLPYAQLKKFVNKSEAARIKWKE